MADGFPHDPPDYVMGVGEAQMTMQRLVLVAWGNVRVRRRRGGCWEVGRIKPDAKQQR
ncbi:hypothetical protein IFM12275_51100 [Nocardia sputorum]|uniref:Uncharacterized protein n=1 Tax=Nocardia sputorum TaxID=2984338 RepID=A0ABN6U8L8_9NOCA|nr:hypothetical protein IFM12275_51100 [Nocardia sputorum]BDU01609.1 hypothetical protein IFM12276_46370 [Nocardia sputorum]